MLNYVKRFAHFAVALIVVLFFFIGAGSIGKHAHKMELLRSQGGTSVAEAYYQAHGGALAGDATVDRGMGLGLAAIIIYLGELLNKGKEKTEKAAVQAQIPAQEPTTSV
jgi:hypothetical protein